MFKIILFFVFSTTLSMASVAGKPKSEFDVKSGEAIGIDQNEDTCSCGVDTASLDKTEQLITAPQDASSTETDNQ